MRYLVTGITGFAGPHLARLLVENGHDVSGLTRATNGRENDIRDILSDNIYNKIRFIHSDITDERGIERVFKEHRFDGVFHLAAQSHPPTSFSDHEGTYRTNVGGTKNIIEAIKNHQRDCALMFCSTSEVYGNVPKEKSPITEDFPLKGQVNPYALSKAISDVEVLGHASVKAEPFNLPFFVTRAFSHTGPRRGKNFSISSDAYQIVRIKKGFQEPVILVGNLTPSRVVIDVQDCVKAYDMLMEHAVQRDERVIGEAFNVSGTDLHQIGYFLDEMLKISGLEDKVEKQVHEPYYRKIDIGVQMPDVTKIRKTVGWEPKIPLKQTLSGLLDYWDRKITI
jgi:GDPmannose 4,6-dehydratase